MSNRFAPGTFSPDPRPATVRTMLTAQFDRHQSVQQAARAGARTGQAPADGEAAQDSKPREPDHPSLFHENIRGPGYYH